jgi:hypothetical protein
MCCRKLVTLRHVALSQPVIVVALPLIRLEASVCGGEGGGSRGGMVSCHDSPWALSQTAMVVPPPLIGLGACVCVWGGGRVGACVCVCMCVGGGLGIALRH